MTTVRELFAGAGLTPSGCVKWGTTVPLQTPGVYAIATTHDIDEASSITSCPIDPSSLRFLMQQRPEIAVDGVPATEQSLAARLSSMWLPSEPVVYVGLAGTSLSGRIDQYYTTPLGARSPHAGGWPLKVLSILTDLWVHYAESADPDRSETEMVDTFVRGIPSQVSANSCDPATTVPYANLMFPGGRKKRHGITGAKQDRASRPAIETSPSPSTPVVRSMYSPTRSQLRTQRITSSDIAGSRIRIPRESKGLFPRERQYVDLVLRGEALTCRWDPRTGPDRERSGVISVPKDVLRRLVRDDEELAVSATPSGLRLD